MINVLIVENSKSSQVFWPSSIDKETFYIIKIIDSTEKAFVFLQESSDTIDLLILNNNLAHNSKWFDIIDFLKERLKPGIIFFISDKKKEDIQKLAKYKPLTYLLEPTNTLQLNLTLQFAYTNLQLRIDETSWQKKNKEKLQAFDIFFEFHEKPCVLLEDSKIKNLNLAARHFFNFQKQEEFNSLFFYSLLPQFQTNGIHSVIYFENQINKLGNKIQDSFELLLKKNSKEALVEVKLIKVGFTNEKYLLTLNEIDDNLLDNSALQIEIEKLKQIYNSINIGIFLIETKTFHIVEANTAALFLSKKSIKKLKKDILGNIFDSKSVKKILKQETIKFQEGQIKTFDIELDIQLSLNTVHLSNQNYLIASFVPQEKESEQHKNKNLVKLNSNYLKLLSEKKSFDESLNYARRIQSALLPSDEYLKRYLKDYFIYLRPKEIVSGDFYWANYHNGNLYFAVGDATGHGVPGAFMSILGMSILNEIVNELEKGKASLILDMLRNKIIKVLHQKSQFGELQDGFDMSLLIINVDKMRMQFSGANMSFFMLRNDKIVELKGDRMPIGVHPKAKLGFTNHIVRLEIKDKLYLYSDGIIHQFGGDKNRKLTFEKLISFIHKNKNQSMISQSYLWETFISEWMKNEEQTDDMLLVGIEL